MGGLSIWHWLVFLLVVVVIFGTKRLTGAGKDIGSAIKEFKKAMREDDASPAPKQDDTTSKPKDDDDRNPPVVR